MSEQELTQEELERLSQGFIYAIAEHEGSFRSDGVPYVSHPIRVALHALSLGMTTEAVIAAVLHDVVEDTDISIRDVEEEFDHDIADIVAALTKPAHGTPNRNQIYESQLLNGPEEARMIKLLDIQDNLSDVEDFLEPEAAAAYRKSREALAQVLRASLPHP
ncbi:MAG: HD domain-containing protein [Candidatus Thorarchaeota archaeon]